MYLAPLALAPALPSELIEYVLRHQVYATTLIICQPRATFLTSLLRCVPHVLPKSPAPTPDPADLPPSDINAEQGEDPEADPDDDVGPPKRPPLLIPTLYQIATSRHINLVFTPTLSHLRAYLAVFPPEPKELPPAQVSERKGNRPPLLVVYSLLECHRHTSEWSGQGLGNSLSGLVDAGYRMRRKVVLFEELSEEVDADQDEDGVGGNTRRKCASKVWEERVPVLNGSVKRAVLESEDVGWSGRTVEVGRILARWFKFGRGEWES